MKTFEIKTTKTDNSAFSTYWSTKFWWTSMIKFIKDEMDDTKKGWAITSIKRID